MQSGRRGNLTRPTTEKYENVIPAPAPESKWGSVLESLDSRFRGNDMEGLHKSTKKRVARDTLVISDTCTQKAGRLHQNNPVVEGGALDSFPALQVASCSWN
ncbi:MAG: hypothetical protein HW414_533 [Dehalococcoidia bacterium]|nr:hypothetical protein [Dehalococcoidia bacterium]